MASAKGLAGHNLAEEEGSKNTPKTIKPLAMPWVSE
tara:strand:+ start:620 stop:727 length:108 start_codon:yes stop_codon:yes gene_type:complete